MIPDKLKREAIAAWQDYAAALSEAFHFGPGGLDTFPVDQAFRTEDPSVVESFIRYARRAAEEVRKMKFVGER
jgi:hypothetical protein